jgi:hypothetical protein
MEIYLLILYILELGEQVQKYKKFFSQNLVTRVIQPHIDMTSLLCLLAFEGLESLLRLATTFLRSF